MKTTIEIDKQGQEETLEVNVNLKITIRKTHRGGNVTTEVTGEYEGFFIECHGTQNERWMAETAKRVWEEATKN